MVLVLVRSRTSTINWSRLRTFSGRSGIDLALLSLFTALLLAAALPTKSAAQLRDRDVGWLTIETQHFRIHYHEPLGVLARQAAAVAERAHHRLSKLLRHTPQGKTDVLITDGTDSANGSATAVPYRRMRLLATAPEDISALGDFDDWIELLITHEHVHILHLDTVHGLPALYNTLFGRTFTPNSVQPRFIIEGIATYYESRETLGGRLRSTTFDMFLRMAALDNKLLRIDQLSNNVDAWPRGHTWYLYGSRFIAWVAEKYGQDFIARLSRYYGGRFPLGINRAFKHATGYALVDLYDQWLADTTSHYKQVAKRIRTRGEVTGRRLTFGGEFVRSPRFLSNQEVLYYTFDGRSDPTLRRRNLLTGNAKDITRVASESYVSADYGNEGYVFSDLNVTKDVYRLNDLHTYDKIHGVRRITHGLRARYPDVSKDGKRIAYTINSSGSSHLVIANRRTPQKYRVLFRSRAFEQVYTPKFSPDGHKLAFSRWQKGKGRTIEILDLRRGSLKRVALGPRQLATGPEWSPDGHTLYLSSDRSGIANIYAYDTNSETLSQLTNVIGGAYSPTVSPDGKQLVYVGYGNRGWDLYQLKLDRTTTLSMSPVVDRPTRDVANEEVVANARTYQPLSTLYPRAISVDFGALAGNPALSVSAVGEDIAQFHRIQATITSQLEDGHTSFGVDWSFNRTRVPFSLSLYRTENERQDLFTGGERRSWTEESLGARASTSFSLPSRLVGGRMSLSYRLEYLRPTSGYRLALDPTQTASRLPETGRFASLAFSYNHRSARAHTFDMSPSEGMDFGFGANVAHPGIGSNFSSVSLSWSWRGFFELPFIQHHVLAFRYAGGISGGDPGRRRVFGLGGYPNYDWQNGLLSFSQLGGVGLRGYPSNAFVGRRFQLLQLEYRVPLWRPMVGPRTLPIYVKRVHAATYLDLGDAYVGRWQPNIKLGGGIDLYATFDLFYVITLNARIGVARGFMEEGEWQFYGHLGVPF